MDSRCWQIVVVEMFVGVVVGMIVVVGMSLSLLVGSCVVGLIVVGSVVDQLSLSVY